MFQHATQSQVCMDTLCTLCTVVHSEPARHSGSHLVDLQEHLLLAAHALHAAAPNLLPDVLEGCRVDVLLQQCGSQTYQGMTPDLHAATVIARAAAL